jgi:hypothetical protein
MPNCDGGLLDQIVLGRDRHNLIYISHLELEILSDNLSDGERQVFNQLSFKTSTRDFDAVGAQGKRDQLISAGFVGDSAARR